MSETKEKKRKSSDDDDKKERKRAKRAENHKLKEQLPKTDENGIAYTKLQVRKMLKRVKRGLPPIPTKQEEQELKRQEAETRKEEEAEFAGLADSLVSEKKEEDSQDSDDEKDEDTRAREHGEGSTDQSFPKHDETTTTRKRKKRSKPVPDDYVCQACKNEHEPKHWIYDCPNKVTLKEQITFPRNFVVFIHPTIGKCLFLVCRLTCESETWNSCFRIVERLCIANY
jgi:hypothetical protein